MEDSNHRGQAVELLQQLGLKEYEARCFVALTRLPRGTAKEVSEVSEVPRTRVYDAVGALEERGLVEVQHTNPQQFRAVGVDEAVRTLRSEFEARTGRLRETLSNVESAAGGDPEATHEVWALAGAETVAARAVRMVEGASEEVALVLGGRAAANEALFDALRDAVERGVEVTVGTADASLRDRVRGAVPGAESFVSGLKWLTADEQGVDIGLVALVDRKTVLVSSRHPGADPDERAVYGTGLANGLVVVARRLLTTGLPDADDPGD